MKDQMHWLTSASRLAWEPMMTLAGVGRGIGGIGLAGVRVVTADLHEEDLPLHSQAIAHAGGAGTGLDDLRDHLELLHQAGGEGRCLRSE